jgi:uncharacterized GH25 family protein
MPSIRLARRVVPFALAMLLVAVAIADAHDLFFKPDRYHLAENTEVVIPVLNGTFSKSENSIARVRIRDISIVGPRGRFRADTTTWSDAGDTSRLRFRTAAAGTYVIGASTTASTIALAAKDFNQYLADDGIPDVLEARRKAGALKDSASERYHKHIKTLLQVGDARSDAYKTELGYPAELIPLENPYTLRPGATLSLRCLVDGKPAPNQFVQVGGRTPTGGRIAMRGLRADSEGVVRMRLSSAGAWYVKFIHMSRVTADTVDYESKWASLTFETR